MCAAHGDGILRVVVLASGRGSNFAALLEAQRNAHMPIELCAVLSDRADARVLDIARLAGIPTVALTPKDYRDRAQFDSALFERVAAFNPDLIVLAGYMRIIDAGVINAQRVAMINIHPSLLPAYAGLRTHQRVLDAHETMHGASVHLVTPQLDGGPVIAQVTLSTQPGESARMLAGRLLPLEHRLLVAAVGAIATGEIALHDGKVTTPRTGLRLPLNFSAADFD